MLRRKVTACSVTTVVTRMSFSFPFIVTGAASSSVKKTSAGSVNLRMSWPRVTPTNRSSDSQNEQEFGVSVLLLARWVIQSLIKLVWISHVRKWHHTIALKFYSFNNKISYALCTQKCSFTPLWTSFILRPSLSLYENEFQ